MLRSRPPLPPPRRYGVMDSAGLSVASVDEFQWSVQAVSASMKAQGVPTKDLERLATFVGVVYGDARSPAEAFLRAGDYKWSVTPHGGSVAMKFAYSSDEARRAREKRAEDARAQRERDAEKDKQAAAMKANQEFLAKVRKDADVAKKKAAKKKKDAKLYGDEGDY